MFNSEELRTLANSYEENGDYENAHKLYRRAFLIEERTVGKNSPQLVPFLYDLAMINLALDNEKEAKELLTRAARLLPIEHELAKEISVIARELEDSLTAA